MAFLNVEMKIMPKGVEINLDELAKQCVQKLKEIGGKIAKPTSDSPSDKVIIIPLKEETLEVLKSPVAFGLNSLRIFFTIEEKPGGTDPIEEAMTSIEGVQSVEFPYLSRIG